MSQQYYRHDVDGLRAIAVLSVIIFHIQEKWLPQGFLGVDIFFVISGFLITGIIKREMEQQRFSFIEFYKRRAIRILPAFLFFLAIISGLSYPLLIEADFAKYMQSVLYALAFSANIYFAQQNDYFDISATEKPLLHIWSLSIEEQFYFIFPLILFILIKFNKNRYIQPVILLGIVISSIYYFTPTAWNSYFLPQARVFELLIGALFACYPQKQLTHNRIHFLLLAIIAIVLFLPKDFLVSDGYIEKIIICSATGFLLYLKPNHEKFNVLSIKPLVYIGLISYSLYLWHWGILALIRYSYMQYELKPTLLVFAIITMFTMAIISYYWVENPIRNIKNRETKRFIPYMILYVIFYLIVLIMVWKYSQYLQIRKISNHTCHQKEILEHCSKGADVAPRAVLYGDSHAGHYNKFIDYIGKKEGWSADVVSADRCRFPLFVENNVHIGSICKNVQQYILQHFSQYDSIMISMYWYDAMARNKQFLEIFAQDLEQLSKTGKQIYVFKDNPRVNVIPLRQKRQSEIGLRLKQEIHIYEEEQVANQKIQQLVEQYPNVHWVDIPKYIPDNFMLDGYPIYKDGDHINPYGALELAKAFSQHERLLK